MRHSPAWRWDSVRSRLRRSLALLLAVAGLAVPAAAQASSLVRVTVDDPARLRALGLDVTENGDVVLASADDRRVLERAGSPSRTLVRALEAQARRARAVDARVATASALPSGRTTYRR